GAAEAYCRDKLAGVLRKSNPEEYALSSSLRKRRELATMALYDDPVLAIYATRVVGRYPAYISELACEVPRVSDDVRKKIIDAHHRSVERVHGRLIELLPSKEELSLLTNTQKIADRMIADPDYVSDIADAIEMPRPFSLVLKRELE